MLITKVHVFCVGVYVQGRHILLEKFLDICGGLVIEQEFFLLQNIGNLCTYYYFKSPLTSAFNNNKELRNLEGNLRNSLIPATIKTIRSGYWKRSDNYLYTDSDS
jgi:hypothetical protein